MPKTLSKSRVARLSALARRIDSSEKESIKARGRAIKAEHDRVREVIQKLVAGRNAKGLTLEEVGRLTKIGKANLSRLENSPGANPTLSTLLRYAQAVGKKVVID